MTSSPQATESPSRHRCTTICQSASNTLSAPRSAGRPAAIPACGCPVPDHCPGPEPDRAARFAAAASALAVASRRGPGRAAESGAPWDTGRVSLGLARTTRNPSISHVIAPAKLMAIHTQVIRDRFRGREPSPFRYHRSRQNTAKRIEIQSASIGIHATPWFGRRYGLVVVRAAEIVATSPADELAAVPPEPLGAVGTIHGIVLRFHRFPLGWHGQLMSAG